MSLRLNWSNLSAKCLSSWSWGAKFFITQSSTFKAETKKREQNLLHLNRNGQNEAQIVEDRVTKIGSSEAYIREWMECYAEIFEFIEKRVTQIGK